MAVTVDELLKGKQPQAPAQPPLALEQQEPQTTVQPEPQEEGGTEGVGVIAPAPADYIQNPWTQGDAEPTVQPSQPPVQPEVDDHGLSEMQQIRANADAETQREKESQQRWAGYDDVLKKLYLETDEDKKKREKRERLSRIFSAIGDGISALSNLYFTTKGAPNAYTGDNTLSERWRARKEELRKEREANKRSYLSAYLDMLKQQARDRSAEDLAKYRRSMAAYNQEKEARQLKESEARIAKMEAEIEYKNQMLEFNRQKEQAREDYNNKKLSLDGYKARLQAIKIEEDKAKQNYRKTTTTSEGGKQKVVVEEKSLGGGGQGSGGLGWGNMGETDW